jgi:hypothetical protein
MNKEIITFYESQLTRQRIEELKKESQEQDFVIFEAYYIGRLIEEYKESLKEK